MKTYRCPECGSEKFIVYAVETHAYYANNRMQIQSECASCADMDIQDEIECLECCYMDLKDKFEVENND